MENATKALIIAGAILVAILLVTMGIALLSNTGALQDEQDKTVSSMNVSSFNGKLTPAEGKNVSGSKVQGVLDDIYLMYIDDPNTPLTVTYKSAKTGGTTITAAPGTSAITNIKSIQNAVKSTLKYEVQLVKDDTNGYIKQMTITQNKS